MRVSRTLFGHDFTRSVEGCACGGHCAGCRANALAGLGAEPVDETKTTGYLVADKIFGTFATMLNPGTSAVSNITKLFGGAKQEREVEAAQQFARIQAQQDIVYQQQRSQSTEQWTETIQRVGPWLILGLGGVVVTIILVRRAS